MTSSKPHWETPQILSDLPLSEKDRAYFHFEEFAVTLARLIAAPATRTPLTIGISGPWGSGKTTLLQSVQRLLETRNQRGIPAFANSGETANTFRACKTVWFDAWKYNDEDEILVALVRVLLEAMKKDGLFNAIKAGLEDPQQSEYDLIGMFINAFQLKFGGLGAEVQFKLDPEKFEKKSPFTSHTAFFDHFNDAFERLMARWVHGTVKKERIDDQKGALVVFIDDLDRCLPEKTVQLLEAVKLFLDKDGCVFVLGAHTEVVQQAVKKIYEVSGVTPDNASDYLEKIIQLRFELPPIFEHQMGAFITAQGLPSESIENWETIVVGAEINPRKVKTFLNDLNLAWALLVNTGQAKDVDRADFTRWQVLMRAAPDSFKKAVYEIYDLDLRFKFIQRALAWQNGDDQAAEYFRDYEKYNRLKHTLKKISAYSPRFDAKALDAFIHLVAPPKPAVPEKAPAEVKEAEEKVGFGEVAAEGQIPTRGEVPPEKGRRGEAVPSHPSVRVFAGMDFVPVPKGKFLMGSREDNQLASDDEKPQHTVEIPQDYWMARFPVTNKQYEKFVTATNQQHKWAKDWKKKLDHPVVNVSWYDAMTFCEWLNQTYGTELPDGLTFRLPTEAEWEKAARGEFGFEWPWGNDYDANKCNSSEGRIGATTPVGAYSRQGDSPYGCADIVGNVWEWTYSLYEPYPYRVDHGHEGVQSGDVRVLRGGSFNDSHRYARCASRYRNNPSHWYDNRGFRVGLVSPIFISGL